MFLSRQRMLSNRIVRNQPRSQAWWEVFPLEHFHSDNQVASTLMEALNPIVVTVIGVNINRRNVENVRKKDGLWKRSKIQEWMAFFKLIQAREV